MAITVGEVMEIMSSLAPAEYEYTQDYDNIGLLLGDKNALVERVLCCLDVTERVIDEAASLGARLIISHHPMIYGSISRITADDVLGRKILKAAHYGISVFAAHTNLDFAPGGINDYVARLIGLINIKPLLLYNDGKAGFGRVGDLTSSVYCSVLKGEVESVLRDSCVRMAGEPYAQVSRVAVINGGGGGDVKYVDAAIAAGADCLITADVKHHVAMYAFENGVTLIEPQHFTMEHCYISRLVQNLKLEAKARKAEIDIVQSRSEQNPRF